MGNNTAGNPISSTLIAANIKTGITIFGILSSMPAVPANTNGTAGQLVITIPAGYSDGTETTTANDADLIASNIKSGANIFGINGSFVGSTISGGFGYFMGSYGTDANGSREWSVADGRTIDMGSFVYLFALCTFTPTGSTARGAAVLCAKIEKSTGIMTVFSATHMTVSTSNTAVLGDTYVDGTDIYINYAAGASVAYFKVDTLTDALTAVTGSSYTTGTITNTTVVIDSGITYTALALISPDNTTVGAANSSYAGYACTYVAPFDYANTGLEVNSPANTLIRGFFMKDDGTAFYIQNATNGTVQEYTLGTPWDLSTYSYLSQTTITRYGLYRGNSGQYQYSVLGQTTDRVYRMTASTPWLLSSLGSSQNYNPSAECADVVAVQLKDVGTKMYLLDASPRAGFGGSNTIYQYSLSTPYQISSGVTYDTVSLDITQIDNYAIGFSFSTNGTELYVVGVQYNSVYKYNLGTAWDLSTAVYSGEVIKYGPFSKSNPIAISFKPDMSIAFIANNADTSAGSVNNIDKFT